jgi:hypothetical protein
MAAFIFDASGIVKRYLTEIGSGWVQGLTDPAVAHEFFLTRLSSGNSLWSSRASHGIAGHSDIRTTELYFVRKEEDAEVAARRIQIRLTQCKGE